MSNLVFALGILLSSTFALADGKPTTVSSTCTEINPYLTHSLTLDQVADTLVSCNTLFNQAIRESRLDDADYWLRLSKVYALALQLKYREQIQKIEDEMGN